MMNRFCSILVACLFAVMFLSSCGQRSKEYSKTENIDGESISSEETNIPDSSEHPDTSDDDKNKLQMEIVSSKNGIIASGMIGNEQGCYEIFYRPTGDGNIIYTDYATQNRVYLSSQVTSTHNDSTDTSWLPSTVGGCYFALSDTNLILFKLNTPAFADDDSEETQGYIARYDLNGSNRQVLAKLSSNETIADGCIVSDSKNIYYLEYFVNEDGSNTPTILAKLNISTGERTEICQLPQDSRHFIVGTYNDKIILKSVLNPVNIAEISSGDELVNAYKQQVHEISLISQDGQQQSVCKWKQGTRSEVFDNNTMYYWDNENQAMYRWDFENNSEICLYSGAVIGANGTNYTDLTLRPDTYDEHILATAPDPDDPNNSIRLAYDLQSNTFSELTLSANERDVEILAEGAQFFLVQIGLKEYPVADYAPNGQEIVTEMLLPDIRLMKKTDYWNNLPEYIPIKENVYI